ncbi:thiolase family protein [Photobacterium kasasachensis]|uniref:thiolase family protein n=1 Tax=Photobacterium kasasachensis TaxID=2910240 RepID=UPI003D0D14BD
MLEEIVIVNAARTAMGRFQGQLSSLTAAKLGLAVCKSVTHAESLSRIVDHVVLGQGLQAGHGQNPARQIAMQAGIDSSAVAYSLNQVCSSGLLAVIQASQCIALRDSEVAIAGGTESMSNAPFLLNRSTIQPEALGELRLMDSLMQDGLTCAINGEKMGMTAERIAKAYQISRGEQDAYALLSSQRLKASALAGQSAQEIVPVHYLANGKVQIADKDQLVDSNVDEQSLSALLPAFTAHGTVTAGNSSGINDGAAAVLLMSAKRAAQEGIEPMARVLAWSSVGYLPEMMGMSPVPAINQLLQRARMTIQDIDQFEINEAFAVQVLAIMRDLGLDPDKVNPRGGALAMGHPIGASGARILVTLLHSMKMKDESLGIATVCAGGGQSTAILVERLS